MKPVKLLIMQGGPDDIFLPVYVIKENSDWIPSHRRARDYEGSIHDNLHNDEVHGVTYGSQQKI
jgi:hypothetical protein